MPRLDLRCRAPVRVAAPLGRARMVFDCRALGSYSIWHDRMRPTIGRINGARYRLLQQLDRVQEGDCRNVHSVLIQRSADFTIYLRPVKIGEGEAG